MTMEQLRKGILKHLKRHALNGRWIQQRKMRNSLHADSAQLFNETVVALAMDGSVELDTKGPRRQKVIRLKPA